MKFWRFYTHIVIIESITVLVNSYFLNIYVIAPHQVSENILYNS